MTDVPPHRDPVLGAWLVQPVQAQHLLLLWDTFGEEVASHKPNLRSEALRPRSVSELALWNLGLVKLSTVEFQWKRAAFHCWWDSAVARGTPGRLPSATAVLQGSQEGHPSAFNNYTGSFNINRMKGCRHRPVKMRVSKCGGCPAPLLSFS